MDFISLSIHLLQELLLLLINQQFLPILTA